MVCSQVHHQRQETILQEHEDSETAENIQPHSLIPDPDLLDAAVPLSLSGGHQRLYRPRLYKHRRLLADNALPEQQPVQKVL